MAEWEPLEKSAQPFNFNEFHDYFFTLLASERDDFEMQVAMKMNDFLCCCPNGATSPIWFYRDSDEDFDWFPLKKESAQQTFANFEYEEQVGKKKIRRTAFDIWMKSPMRRYLDRFCFDPDLPHGFITNGIHVRYNVWEGLSPIVIQDEEKAEEGLAAILFHLREVLCRGNDELYDYVLQWLASKVQNPSKKSTVALVFSGMEGAGKSVFWEKVCKAIFGRHGFVLPDAKMLTHQFAGQYMNNRVFLVVNETNFNDKRDANLVKNMLTCDTIKTEKKFQNMQVSKAHFNMVMTSNNFLKSFPVEPGTNRRYLSIQADGSRANRGDYFDGLLQALNGDGVQAFHRFLLTVPITIDLRLPPHTEEKSDAVAHQFSAFEDFWMGCLNNHTHENATGMIVDPGHRYWATEGCNIQNLWKLFQIKYPKMDWTEVSFQNELKSVLPPIENQNGVDLGTALNSHEKIFTMPRWKACNDHFAVLKGIRNSENSMVQNRKRKLEYNPEQDKRRKSDIRSHFK